MEERFCVECNLINGKHFYFNDVALDDDTDIIYTTFEEAWKCLGDILSHKVSTQENLLAWLREFTQDESSLGCIASFQVITVFYNERTQSWEDYHLSSPIINHYWGWDRHLVTLASYKDGRLNISPVYDFSLDPKIIPSLIENKTKDFYGISKSILKEIWKTEFEEESWKSFLSHYGEEIIIIIQDPQSRRTFQLLYKNN